MHSVLLAGRHFARHTETGTHQDRYPWAVPSSLNQGGMRQAAISQRWCPYHTSAFKVDKHTVHLSA